jgi:hypothetical protein
MTFSHWIGKFPGHAEQGTIPPLYSLKLGLQRNSKLYSSSCLIVAQFLKEPSPVMKFQMKDLSEDIEYD